MTTKSMIVTIAIVGIIAAIMIFEYFSLVELWFPLLWVPLVIGIILFVFWLKRRKARTTVPPTDRR